MDSISLLLLLVFLFLLLKILFPSTSSPSNNRNERIVHPVTPEMIETVASLFPQIPRDNIRRDLTETGNVNLTIDRIVECRGNVFGRNSNSSNRGTGGEKKRDGPLSSAFKEILSGIQQKEKQQQMKSAESAVASASSSSSSLPTVNNSIGGEWSQDPVQRMTQLRLRKERMLLEARQKFQKNQQQEKDSSLLSPQ